VSYRLQLQLASRIRTFRPDPARKHVEFYSKNEFEKLLHLVGFIIRIYHDARSPERQNSVDITPCTFSLMLSVYISNT